MKRGLTGTQLKWVALVLMTLDQIAVYFGSVLPQAVFLRCMGRLALPVFLFLAVEGYSFTANRRLYILRLGGLAIGMGALNQLAGALSGLPAPTSNAFATLFYSVLLFYVYDQFTDESKQNRYIIVVFILIVFLDTIVVVGQPYLWEPMRLFFTEIFPVPSYCDGGVKLLLLAVILFATRERRLLQALLYGFGSLLLFGVFRGKEAEYQWMMLFAVGLFLLYNGKRGERPMKYFFSAYYPAHVYLLYTLAVWLGAWG